MYIAFIACVNKLYIFGMRIAIMVIEELSVIVSGKGVGSERHSSMFLYIIFIFDCYCRLS